MRALIAASKERRRPPKVALSHAAGSIVTLALGFRFKYCAVSQKFAKIAGNEKNERKMKIALATLSGEP
ncbi:hypothetical protein OAI45_01385 [Planktomarina temperata]|nr:hypothetical protein [Planktomarina temperata]